jgi:hypothetical protein
MMDVPQQAAALLAVNRRPILTHHRRPILTHVNPDGR